jgi:hypothetical protein
MANTHHYYKPDSKNKQIGMQQCTKYYQTASNVLYKTSILGPLLYCISKIKGQEILQKVHAGICRGHISARAVAAKVLRKDFFGQQWLAMRQS